MIRVGAKRAIQFDKSLRYKRQQDYNIFDYEITEFEFASGKKKVYNNINFSIFVDDYCNADCKFCVAQLRYEHKNQIYDKKHIKDADAYMVRLEEILKCIRPIDPSVSITGGEPTMSPILSDILKLVDKYGFRKRTITTNGSGLLNVQDNDTVLNNLIKHNWNHLNISRVHYEDSINKEIMRYNSEKEYCTIEMLKEILSATNNTNLHHRLSCLLLKNGICDVNGIKNYLDFHQSIGADNFIFRELMDYDKKAVNIEKIKYCDENKVRLNDIWEQMDRYPEFKPYLNILGYYYYVEIYKYNNLVVASESADLSQQYIEKEKHKDVVYEMIFHNNGNLCGSWVDNEEILDEYKKG